MKRNKTFAIIGSIFLLILIGIVADVTSGEWGLFQDETVIESGQNDTTANDQQILDGTPDVGDVEDTRDGGSEDETSADSIKETEYGLKDTLNAEEYYSQVEVETELIPDDWEEYTYEEGSVGLFYPPQGKWTREGPDADVAKFILLGDENREGTEITDGIYLTIYSRPFPKGVRADDVVSAVQEQYPDANIDQDSELVLAGRKAYRFTTTGIGEYVHYVIDVPFNEDEFVDISYRVTGESDFEQDYQTIVEWMLLSMFTT
jgi:hypothetical protein